LQLRQIAAAGKGKAERKKAAETYPNRKETGKRVNGRAGHWNLSVDEFIPEPTKRPRPTAR